MQILVTLVDPEAMLLEYDFEAVLDHGVNDRDWGREQLRQFVKQAHADGGIFDPSEGAFFPMSQIKEIGMTVPKSWPI